MNYKDRNFAINEESSDELEESPWERSEEIFSVIEFLILRIIGYLTIGLSLFTSIAVLYLILTIK